MARSSEANTSFSSSRYQYSGLMPMRSRAMKKTSRLASHST